MGRGRGREQERWGFVCILGLTVSEGVGGEIDCIYPNATSNCSCQYGIVGFCASLGIVMWVVIY
jgi:hypothetical protein